MTFSQLLCPSHPTSIMSHYPWCLALLSDAWYVDEAKYAYANLQGISGPSLIQVFMWWRPRNWTMSCGEHKQKKTLPISQGWWGGGGGGGMRSCWKKNKADVDLILKMAVTIYLEYSWKKDCLNLQRCEQTFVIVLSTESKHHNETVLCEKGDSVQLLTLWGMTWASGSIVKAWTYLQKWTRCRRPLEGEVKD